MEPKRNRFFMAMSILMMLGGAAGIIGSVIAVLGAGVLAAALGTSASFGLLIFAALVAWAGGVTGLIAGVTGVKKSENPQKMMTCIVFGALTAVFSVLGNILAVAGGDRFSAVSVIIGLVLPGLYLLGAIKSGSRS